MIYTIISIYIYNYIYIHMAKWHIFWGGLAYTLYELHSTGRCPSNRDVRLSLQAPQGDPWWVEIWEGENAPSHQHFYGVYKPSPNARFMIKSITLYYTTNTSLLRIYYYCHDCCVYIYIMCIYIYVYYVYIYILCIYIYIMYIYILCIYILCVYIYYVYILCMYIYYVCIYNIYYVCIYI